MDTPHIRELTRVEMEAILARNNVGRIAYAFQDRVDIEPISYVYANDGHPTSATDYRGRKSSSSVLTASGASSCIQCPGPSMRS